MKIIKFKKLSGNKYELLLDNNEKVKIYEDVILKENLLWKKEIEDIDDLQAKNKKHEIEEVALKRLSHHVESIKGMEEFLLKKNYDKDDISKVIEKLVSKGYLNDNYFAKCYINNQINLSNDGPLKIKKYLESHNIETSIYSELLDQYNNIWQERINKIIEKQLKINNKSSHYFKNKMLVNLVNLGYEKEMINDSLCNVTISNQDELRKKEEEKLRIKLSRKYTGNELERKIKEKLYQKGFF